MQDKQFVFSSYTHNDDRTEFSFFYEMFADKQYQFVEKLLLPKTPEDIPEEFLDKLLFNIHLILGISYWKTFCPSKIILKTKRLTKAQANFWNSVYTKGLGEFFYKNKIDYRELVKFPYEENFSAPMNLVNLQLKDRALVGIGGGKDSIVASELLKKINYAFSGLIIDTQNNDQFLKNIADLLTKETIIVKRVIDKNLISLNKQSDVFNGHVPISAINAWIGVLTAILYGYRYVVVGNEKSADYGNVKYLDEMINHQWSKSFEFEKMFRDYVSKNITNSSTYFSLLRPYSEIKITQIFADYPNYFNHFSSCNTNFSITKSVEKKWCCECPKCAFVFVLLTAFLSKEKVVQIFGENLLSKESLIKTYKELLGITGVKPFECVGTPEEVTVAFYLTHEKGGFDQDVAMKMFLSEAVSNVKNIEQMKQDVFATGDTSSIPEPFKGLF